MPDGEAEAENPPIDHSTRASELVALFRRLANLPSNLNLAEAWGRLARQLAVLRLHCRSRGKRRAAQRGDRDQRVATHEQADLSHLGGRH